MSRVLSSLLLMAAGLASAEPFSLSTPAVPDVAAVERYEVRTPFVPYAGTAKADFPQGLPLAVGSSLRFKGYDKKTSALEFWSVTDRGPNGDAPAVKTGSASMPAKLFPVADFTPAIAQLRVDLAQSAEVTRVLPIREGGRPVTGRPLAPGSTGATGEVGLAETMATLPYDPLGLDPEGIDIDRQGHLWVVDEYGPFLAEIDSQTGNVLRRLAPGKGLPDILRYRQPNRGFEGVTVTPSGKVVAAVQSTLDIDGKTRHSARFVRLVEFDPATGATRQFAYPVPEHFRKAGDLKLGDIAALSDTRFAVIEQGKDADKKMHNDVVVIDTAAATDLSGKTLADGRALEFGTLAEAGISPVKRAQAIDLRTLGWTAEKAEGIAVIEPNQIAIINDNDFGLTTRVEGGKGNADDYVWDSGSKRLLDAKGASADGVRVGIAPNGEATQLFVITLTRPLKDWL